MTFYLSKVLWLIINPINILLSLIFIGVFVHIFSKGIFHKFFYFLALIMFIFSAVMPSGQFMVYQLEKKFHTIPVIPSKIDGILILSGATNPGLTKAYNQIELIFKTHHFFGELNNYIIKYI